MPVRNREDSVRLARYDAAANYSAIFGSGRGQQPALRADVRPASCLAYSLPLASPCAGDACWRARRLTTWAASAPTPRWVRVPARPVGWLVRLAGCGESAAHRWPGSHDCRRPRDRGRGSARGHWSRSSAGDAGLFSRADRTADACARVHPSSHARRHCWDFCPAAWSTPRC